MSQMIDRNSKVALYEQIKEYIKSLILMDELKPDDLVPSEFELADKFSVSRITAKRALDDLCVEGFVHRIQGKGTFVKALEVNERQVQGRIGAVMPFYPDYFAFEIIGGIEQVAQDNNFEFILRNSNGEPEKEKRIIEDYLVQDVQGIVVLPCYSTEEVVQFYQQIFECNVPLVFVDKYLPDLDVDYVVSDNYGGAYDATKRFIDNGHTDIAIIAPVVINASSVAHRMDGYKSALLDHGIGVNDELILCNIDRGDTRVIADFVSTVNPTAVFTLNEHVAIDTLYALRDLRVSIPQDMSMVTFDDINIMKYIDIPVSAVKQQVSELGKTACRILVDRLKYKTCLRKHIVLPTEFMCRNSIDAPRFSLGNAGEL